MGGRFRLFGLDVVVTVVHVVSYLFYNLNCFLCIRTLIIDWIWGLISISYHTRSIYELFPQEYQAFTYSGYRIFEIRRRKRNGFNAQKDRLVNRRIRIITIIVDEVLVRESKGLNLSPRRGGVGVWNLWAYAFLHVLLFNVPNDLRSCIEPLNWLGAVSNVQIAPALLYSVHCTKYSAVSYSVTKSESCNNNKQNILRSPRSRGLKTIVEKNIPLNLSLVMPLNFSVSLCSMILHWCDLLTAGF